MKKLILSACAAVFMFGVADVKAEDEKAEDEVVAEEQTCLHKGLYAGLGLGVNYTEVLLDDYETQYQNHNYENHNKGSNPMLSVVLGYMWNVKERFHVGLEASVDLGKACIYHQENQTSGAASKYFDASTSLNGITPFLGLKIGFVCGKGLMPYITLGGSYSSAKSIYTEWSSAGDLIGVERQKVCKIAPTVKIGFTKPVRNNWMLSAEASWKAATDNSRDYTDGQYTDTVKLKNRDAFAFRLLMTHSFKFGK